MQNNDPQTVWQNQNTEEIKVSLAYFKVKAEQLRSRNLWIVVANDFACLAAIVILGFSFMKIQNAISRLGLVLLAVGLLYAMYQTHKQLWPSSPASGTTPNTGLEAYRRELLRWQARQHGVWRTLAPLLPGAIVFAIPGIAPLFHMVSTKPAILKNALPFCILLVIWFVAFIVVRKRRLRNIRQELDALGS